MPDLVSGRAHFYINPMLAMISQIQAGRIRLIAVTSPKRVSSMPDVPTVAESGVPGYEATSWYMIIMPSKTPAPIVSKIHAETVKALKSKDIVDVLAQGRQRARRQHAARSDGVSQGRDRALGQGDQAGEGDGAGVERRDAHYFQSRAGNDPEIPAESCVRTSFTSSAAHAAI